MTTTGYSRKLDANFTNFHFLPQCWCLLPPPPPLRSLFMRGPGQRLAGLRPNITANSFCPTQCSQNPNHKPASCHFFRDWMLVCATSYNGRRLSDVLCSKYLGGISCSPPRWISRITPQHWTTFQKYQKLPNRYHIGKNLPWNKTKPLHITQVHSTKDLDRLGQIKCQEKHTSLEC